MLNLKKTLMELGNHLVLQHGFQPGVIHAAEAGAVARQHGNDTSPIIVFAEWVNRSPEARAFLSQSGIEWPVVVIAAPPSNELVPEIQETVEESRLPLRHDFKIEQLVKEVRQDKINTPVDVGDGTFAVNVGTGAYVSCKLVDVNEAAQMYKVERGTPDADHPFNVIMIRSHQVSVRHQARFRELVKRWKSEHPNQPPDQFPSAPTALPPPAPPSSDQIIES